MKSTSIQSIMK